MKMLISRISVAGCGTHDFTEVGKYGTCYVTGIDTSSEEKLEPVQLGELAEEGYFTLEVSGYCADTLYWHGFDGQEADLICPQAVLDGLLVDCIDQKGAK